MRIQLPFAVLFAAVFACSMQASHAQAQRVFVSATGSDGNPCNFASPCRSFQHAHDTAPAGGEIDVLDPAGYGAVTINKSISIQGHGFSGITVASGANGITINAGSSDAITLNGLIIDGALSGNNGIVFNSGGSLIVTNCVVQNFVLHGGGSTTGDGILIAPTSGTVNFAVTNTIASNNSGIGVYYDALSGSPSAHGVIDHVTTVTNNEGIAFTTDTTGATLVAAVTDSVASNNIIGISVSPTGSMTVSIDDVYTSGNDTGISADNNPVVLLNRSVIQGNRIGIDNETGNTFYTYGNNAIDFNQTSNIINPLNTVTQLR